MPSGIIRQTAGRTFQASLSFHTTPLSAHALLRHGVSGNPFLISHEREMRQTGFET
jgi:hypothetical protein